MPSTKNVIVFEMGDYAEQALYYLRKDSPYTVSCFSVTENLIQQKSIFGLPLVPFEDLQQLFPPSEYALFAPMSGKQMNKMREKFYLMGKELGYSFISYISSKAHVETCRIGENCFILEGCNLQPFVRVGNNVTIWCQTHIGHHTEIQDNVFISSNTSICGRVHIGQYSYIGSNVVIDSYKELAEGTLVGHQTLIKKNTEPWSIYTGSPAKKSRVPSDKLAFL